MGEGPSTGYRWYEDLQDEMFAKRMGSEKPGPRYFKMYSLKRKDLIGTRKVGRYICNLYGPYDDWPFKLSSGGKRNTSNFENMDGCIICFSCGHVANRQWYGS